MSIIYQSAEDFPFGPGLFETLRYENGTPLHLIEHWNRLSNSCTALGLSFCFELTQVQNFLLKTIRDRGKSSGVLRLVYDSKSQLSVQDLSLRPSPSPWILIPQQVIPNPLASHKITQREAYEEQRQSALKSGATDTLMLSPEGTLLETTRANFFTILDRNIYTPPLNGKLLPGLMRGRVIQAAKRLDIPLFEKELSREMIERSQENFVTNSVSGIVRVSQILGWWKKSLPDFVADVLIQKLGEISFWDIPNHAIQHAPVSKQEK